MEIETLKTLFTNDLVKLKTEIELYSDETKIWQVEQNIANSAGNLCLHLVGNLNAYIGVGLAKTNYVRQRDLEFSLKNVPRAELIGKINETITVVESALSNLAGVKMTDDFPLVVWEKPTEIGFTLVKLLTHLNYHLGQVNYHRRLLDIVC